MWLRLKDGTLFNLGAAELLEAVKVGEDRYDIKAELLGEGTKIIAVGLSKAQWDSWANNTLSPRLAPE